MPRDYLTLGPTPAEETGARVKRALDPIEWIVANRQTGDQESTLLVRLTDGYADWVKNSEKVLPVVSAVHVTAS